VSIIYQPKGRAREYGDLAAITSVGMRRCANCALWVRQTDDLGGWGICCKRWHGRLKLRHLAEMCGNWQEAGR
jgi:hypothetical protein